MQTGHEVWSLGAKFGIPVVALVLLMMLALAVLLFVMSEEGDLAPMAGFIVVFALVVTVLSAVAYWPFDSTYHKWYEVRGTVETTNKRLIPTSDGNGMSERYVVKFRESKTLYGCDDTRCALAEPGKSLTLSCKKEWQYNAVAGWACNYKQED